MTSKRYLIVSFLFILLPLFLAGCSRTVGTDGSGDADSITMKAAFEGEDGIPLSNCTVRFSDGENSADYQADQDGILTISGLPGEGGWLSPSWTARRNPGGPLPSAFPRGR